MCSVTYRSSPTTTPFLTSHSYDPRLAFHLYRIALRRTPGGGLSFPWTEIRPPPLARPTALASHLTTRGDHFLVLRHPLHNPFVLYLQRTDPMGDGWRPPNHHAKRLGSGNQTNSPPFLLAFLCSAWTGFVTRCRIDERVEMSATGISSSLVHSEVDWTS